MVTGTTPSVFALMCPGKFHRSPSCQNDGITWLPFMIHFHGSAAVGSCDVVLVWSFEIEDRGRKKGLPEAASADFEGN